MPSPLPLPQQTLVEQSWSQAGISPRGSPCHPTPLHPQILGSVFTFSFECQRGGAGLGGGGAGKVVFTYPLLPSPSPPGERSTSHQGRQSKSRHCHYGCLTECVWRSFVCL